MKNKNVALVLTSCNRFDLLELTLQSFFKHNTHPIAEHIIIEDSHNISKLRHVLEKFGDVNFTVLHNEPQIGQMKSIERAYAAVKSDYIFHCEDDWEFYRSGFIEDSFQVLDSDEKIVTVWLREQNDTNKHPIEPELFPCVNQPALRYQIMQRNHPAKGSELGWYGFTLNPGLRRLSDYHLVAPMGQYPSELAINHAYYKLGFKAAIFPSGYLRHLGLHRGIRYSFNQSRWLKDLSVHWRKFKARLLGAKR